MKTLRINRKLEDQARGWEDGSGEFLTGSALWQAGRYSQSATYRAAELSDLARKYVAESMRVNEAEFHDTARLRDQCRGCGQSYRSENLLICLGCDMERCGGCASSFPRNEFGDAVCPLCGGILV